MFVFSRITIIHIYNYTILSQHCKHHPYLKSIIKPITIPLEINKYNRAQKTPGNNLRLPPDNRWYYRLNPAIYSRLGNDLYRITFYFTPSRQKSHLLAERKAKMEKILGAPPCRCGLKYCSPVIPRGCPAFPDFAPERLQTPIIVLIERVYRL